MLNEFAPAKLNLYLHITGRRADGYHDLDSLVTFAGIGDEIRLEAADSFQFTIEGPQAKTLQAEPSDNNLAVKAAKSLAEITGKNLNVKMTLIKNLPIASGIGGGSSDAAAALRILAKHWGIPPKDPRIAKAAALHGQDVPVCLRIENNYMTATGTGTAPELPYADIVMVNPGQTLPTSDVYKAYGAANTSFSSTAQLKETPKDLAALITTLRARKNDLFEPAARLMPAILDVMKTLESTEGCALARMSGSGATCFAIYTDRNAARKAAADIMAKKPDWWVAQTYAPCRSDPRQNF